MKLLVDQNLSHHLPQLLADDFPGSRHVREFSLHAADDRDIWNLAGKDGFVILTKDDDFRQVSAVRGAPPKVIHLSIGNSSTRQVVELIRSDMEQIRSFEKQTSAGVLVLTLKDR